MKDVNDKIHEIEQNPAALLQPFGVMDGVSLLLELSDEMFADGPHVRVRGAAGDDEVIGHVRYALKIEQDYIVRFHVQAKLRGELRGAIALSNGR